MSGLRRLVLRLLNVIRPGLAEPDLAREMASHLVLLEDEFHRRGMTSEEAHLAAIRTAQTSPVTARSLFARCLPATTTSPRSASETLQIGVVTSTIRSSFRGVP
jgi:hypothetical protein